MSWNFKMSAAEFEAQYMRLVQEVDTVVNRKMRKYFEIFEAGALERIHGELMEADAKCTPGEDWDALSVAVNEYLGAMTASAKRVSRMLSNSEKARIHILKAESGVSEDDYRDLIRQIGGVESSRDLVYWEGMILIRALVRKKERKHGKAV